MYPQQLVDRQLADSKSLKVYTLGQVVLWSNPLILRLVRARYFKIYRNCGLRLLILILSYGMAAKLAGLQNNGLWDSVQRKLDVFAESIAQTMQFVQTQNAEGGRYYGVVKSATITTTRTLLLIPQEDYPH